MKKMSSIYQIFITKSDRLSHKTLDEFGNHRVFGKKHQDFLSIAVKISSQKAEIFTKNI